MRKRCKVDFRPLDDGARRLLISMTGIEGFAAVNFNSVEWMCCTVRSGGLPVVVIVLEFKSPFDAHLTTAVVDPTGLSRQLLTAMFRTVFQRAARITALVSPDNIAAMRQVWRMGFRQEGYLRRGYDGDSDALLYGLVPEECPYLMGEPFRFRAVIPTHEEAHRIQ